MACLGTLFFTPKSLCKSLSGSRLWFLPFPGNEAHHFFWGPKLRGFWGGRQTVNVAKQKCFFCHLPSRPKLLEKLLFKQNCFGTINFVKMAKQSLYKAHSFACSLANRDKPVAATLQRKCSGGIHFLIPFFAKSVHA